MRLASDYIHPYKGAGGRPARCRVRIYLPEDLRDAPVVICSELPNNSGGSITNSAEVISAGVIRSHELPTPLIGIEHWPEESTRGAETFELVDFSSYEIEERAPYLGETRARIGGRYLEATGPRHGGSLGRRESVGRCGRPRLGRVTSAEAGEDVIS